MNDNSRDWHHAQLKAEAERLASMPRVETLSPLLRLAHTFAHRLATDPRESSRKRQAYLNGLCSGFNVEEITTGEVERTARLALAAAYTHAELHDGFLDLCNILQHELAAAEGARLLSEDRA